MLSACSKIVGVHGQEDNVKKLDSLNPVRCVIRHSQKSPIIHEVKVAICSEINVCHKTIFARPKTKLFNHA